MLTTNQTASPQPMGPTNTQTTIQKITFSEQALDDVYALFLRARTQLCARGQGHFLLTRPKEAFKKAMMDKDSFLLGAFAPEDGSLLGFCVVRKYKNLQAAYDTKSLTLPDRQGVVRELCGEQGVAVIQSLCVDAALAGKKGIAQKLLRQARAVTPKCRHFAQTGLANLCGIKSFSSTGYVGVGAGTELTECWPSPKLLLLRLKRNEHQKLADKIRITLTPRNPEDLYGLQTAVYRHIAQEGKLVRLRFERPGQTLKAGLIPA